MSERVLPTFLLCGAQKAGTTALYTALQQHPDVCMSRPKETEFFNWRYQRGWEWFSNHFDHYNGETAIGEASTRTMPTPEVPDRIAEHLPNVRLIFLLRNPIERAYSAFWYYVTHGILCPSEDFSTFIRNEGHPLRQEIIEYGRYDRHLDRFSAVFDRTQMLVLFHAELQSETETQLQTVFQFVGVDPDQAKAAAMERKNVTTYPMSHLLYAWVRDAWKPFRRMLSRWGPSTAETIQRLGKASLLRSERPPLAERDRSYLRDVYAPTIRTLQEQYGYELSGWS